MVGSGFQNVFNDFHKMFNGWIRIRVKIQPDPHKAYVYILAARNIIVIHLMKYVSEAQRIARDSNRSQRKQTVQM